MTTLTNVNGAGALPAASRASDRGVLPVRTLGRSGIVVPALGAGGWAIGGPWSNLNLPMGWENADDRASRAGLELAYELGVRLFDTADVYGHGRSERLIGELVAQAPREAVVLVSKVGYFTADDRHRFDPVNMRRQLERSLRNLGTDHLDVHLLHNEHFGTEDEWLDPAVEAMRGFRDEGLVRSIGMRGPHRFALDRLATSGDRRGDKIARFRYLFDCIRPEIIAVRDNLLTPTERSAGIFALADANDCGVLVNKPLGQGLLTGTYGAGTPRRFGPQDHRSRKRWFQPDAAPIIGAGIAELRHHIGADPVDLIATALWSSLERSDRAVVLAGFTTPAQVAMNVAAAARRPSSDMIASARTVMAEIQQWLTCLGEVFVDEHDRSDRALR